MPSLNAQGGLQGGAAGWGWAWPSAELCGSLQQLLLWCTRARTANLVGTALH